MNKDKSLIKKIEALGGVDLEYPFNKLGSFIDHELLKKHCPELWNTIDKKTPPSDLIDEIEQLDDEDASIIQLMNNDPLLCITLQNDEKQYVSFKEIVKIFPLHIYPDAVDFSVLMNFVIYTCEAAIDQAGGIAIWDTTKKGFIFDFFDEGFCVTKMSYDSISNEFLGKFSYSMPWSYYAGEGEFKITSDRKLKTIRYTYIDSENISHSGIGKFFENEE